MPLITKKVVFGIFVFTLIYSWGFTVAAPKEILKNRAEITLTNGQKIILENLRAIYPAGNWINVSAGIFWGLHYRYALSEIDERDKGWTEAYIPFSEIAAIEFHYISDGDRTEDFVIITKKDGLTLSFKRFGVFQSRMKFVIEKMKPPKESETLNVSNWSFSTFEEDRKLRVIWKVTGKGKNEKGELKDLGFLWGTEIKKIVFIK